MNFAHAKVIYKQTRWKNKFRKSGKENENVIQFKVPSLFRWRYSKWKFQMLVKGGVILVYNHVTILVNNQANKQSLLGGQDKTLIQIECFGTSVTKWNIKFIKSIHLQQ